MRFLVHFARFIVARASRTARPASPAWNVSKTMMQSVLFWSLFLLVLPRLVARLEARCLPASPQYLRHPRWKLAGQILFACGGALGLWSGAVIAIRGRGTPLPLDAARRLVLSGPYSRVRNPMALAGLSQGVGVGLWMRSPLVIAYALCGAPAWSLLVRPGEEDALEARFANAYRHYKTGVRLWLPLLRAYREAE